MASSKGEWVRHYRRNADEGLRNLERQAAAGGTAEDVLDYGHALLRAGRIDGPSAAVVGAGLILAGSVWTLHRMRDGWALRRRLRGGFTITAVGDPDLLDYPGGPAGSAVGWLSTPLVHFRVDPKAGMGRHPGFGVVHSHGKNLSDPRSFAAAVHDLGKPERRLLGALTLAADEGRVPHAYGLDSWEEILDGEFPPGGDLEGFLYSGAATAPDEFESALGKVERLLDVSKTSWSGPHQGAPRLLWPVNGFIQQKIIPFPELLYSLGFKDESWKNDIGARATLRVAGPHRKPGPTRREITWHGTWPELEDGNDQYLLTVWCHGLHPNDQEFADEIRYSVSLVTAAGYDDTQVAIGDARTEAALGAILANLGMRPEGAPPRWT